LCLGRIVVFRSQKPAIQSGWTFNTQFKTTRFFVLLYASYLQFAIRFKIRFLSRSAQPCASFTLCRWMHYPTLICNTLNFNSRRVSGFRPSGYRWSGNRESCRHTQDPSSPEPRWSMGQPFLASGISLSGNRRMWCQAFHATQNPEARFRDESLTCWGQRINSLAPFQGSNGYRVVRPRSTVNEYSPEFELLRLKFSK
jgi:hypothetical protein